MKRTLFYKGYTQYENIGDLLINKALLNHFRKFCKIIVSDDKGMPEQYVKGLGLNDNERVTSGYSSFYAILLQSAFKNFLIKKEQVYYLASPPGHQFENSFVVGLKYLLSGFYYMFLRVLGVRIIKIGFSIGPLSPMGKIGERFRSKFVNYYFVRDSISLQFVKDLGIQKAEFFPDLCWTYSPSGEGNLSSPVENGKEKFKIMFSFREAVHSDSSNEEYGEGLLELLKAIVLEYKDAFCFEIVYQVTPDFEFSRLAYDKLGSLGDVSFREKQIHIEEASYYAQAALVLTNRLHVALLAQKFGCLPIIVTDIDKHVKIKGIFTDVKLGTLLIDSNQSMESSLAQFDEILKDRDKLMKELKVAESAQETLSKEKMEFIFSNN
ncbi:MAG: polysaccharide pyruvyl transferase family protein [Cytophagales bacterium]|nr:polysaccharide pyruvyl transferase family protein [Cytophagales bacterium]